MDAPACGSCKISFIGSDSIFAVLCGHLFHESCLDKVYDGEKRCLECNIMCTRSQSLRVFLPFQQEASTNDSLNTKRKKLKHELAEIKIDFDHIEVEQSNLSARREKGAALMNHKNKKVAELKILYKEKENLEKKIAQLEKTYAIQKALTGTANDVGQIIKQNPTADTLASMAVVLKRETKRVEAEKKEIRLEMRESRKENEILTENYRNRREKFEITVARGIKRGGDNS